MCPTAGPFCPICGGHSAPTVVQNGPPGTFFFCWVSPLNGIFQLNYSKVAGFTREYGMQKHWVTLGILYQVGENESLRVPFCPTFPYVSSSAEGMHVART